MDNKEKKKRKAGRVILIIAGIIVVLAVAAGIAAWAMFGTFIKSASTIRELEDGLYCMEYEGDYGLDEFVEKGGANSDAALADYLIGFLSRGFYKTESSVETGEIGCSAICLENEQGDVLFGRNFDWTKGQVMIVQTKPESGYESMSTCLLDFLGFDESYKPDGSMAERMQTLAAIYVPLDGMNEKGLMIADLMAGDDETTNQDTDRPDLTTTTAIRLVLDKAANVEEAIALLEDFDMNSSVGAAHHFAIADSSGRSVVVEYVDNRMMVTDTNVVTNHYIGESPKKGTGSDQSHTRFDMLSKYSEVSDENEMCDIMKSVAQMNFPQSDGYYEETLWTLVYNPAALRADFYYDQNYDHSFGLMLFEKGSYVKS